MAKKNIKVEKILEKRIINTLQPGVAFLYPLKTLENLKDF